MLRSPSKKIQYYLLDAYLNISKMMHQNTYYVQIQNVLHELTDLVMTLRHQPLRALLLPPWAFRGSIFFGQISSNFASEFFKISAKFLRFL